MEQGTCPQSSVFVGDLSLTNFGLKPEIYRELAQSVDTVIHNGALVNHAFTYEQLFEPNVLGSVEVSLPVYAYSHLYWRSCAPLRGTISEFDAMF